MSISVAEIGHKLIAPSTNPATVALAVTPQEGDVVVLICTALTTSTATTIVSASGLGATWAKLDEVTGTNDLSITVLEARGLTAAGNISVSMSASRYGGMRAYLIRGGNNPTITVDLTAYRSTGTTLLTGPSMSVDAGDVVINVAIDATTIANTTFTSTGWSWDPVGGLEDRITSPVQTVGSVYQVPTGPATVSTSINTSVSGRARIGAVRIRSGASAGATAAVDGTMPSLEALAAATVTATAVTAAADASLPSLDASADVVVVEPAVAEVLADLPGLDAVGDVDTTVPAVTVAAAADLPALGGLASVLGAEVVALADGELPGLDGWAGADSEVEDLVTVYAEVKVEGLAWIGLTAAPDPDDVAPIMRESYVMPELDEAHQVYQPHVDYPVIREVVGWLHLWVGGRDVTYFRGVPTLLAEWYREAPFGDKTCAWEMPQLESWEKPGEGELDFLFADAPVEIGIVEPDGTIRQEWAGFFDSRTKGQGQTARSLFEAKGAFWAALHKIHEPVPYQEPIDIGILIPRLLNAIPGKRWNDIPEVITGLKTRERGARGEYVWPVVQRIFSVDGWTADGRQWTLARVGIDDFALVLKSPMTHVDATVAYGTPLVDSEVTIDQSSRVDNAFARGISEKGGGWANVFYPATEIFNGLPYPNSDASRFLNLGTTDADTTSGTGVSDLQEKLRELGYTRMQPTGTLTSKWIEVVRDAQRALDITVDGSTGPQTWEAVFTTVNEDIDLTPIRLPLAFKPETWPTKHGANGQILGPNPAYDPNRIPREVDVDLGPNVSKSRGRKLMRTYLAVHAEPSATGTVEFIGCPNEMDRTRLDIGHNLAQPGFDGETLVVQLASKRVQMDGDSDGRQYVATFTVDERARDALTVDQILERDRAALPDPARRPGNPNRLSRNVRDQAFEWDDESPCGVLPKTAMNGSTGLWTRKVVPFSTVGQLSGIDLRSTVPFAHAIFASLRMTPNKMRALVGNPHASTDPWRPHMEELVEEYGLLGCWGSQGDACGFGWGMESDGYAFNGRFREGSTLEYVTETPPYVSWLFFARGASGFVWGEALAARQS